MRLRYQELVGKPVVTTDGRTVGVVTDLVAERRAAALRVTALQTGPLGLVRRIAFRHIGSVALDPREIPWRLVARIGKQVDLNIDSVRLRQLPKAAVAAPAKPPA